MTGRGRWVFYVQSYDGMYETTYRPVLAFLDAADAEKFKAKCEAELERLKKWMDKQDTESDAFDWQAPYKIHSKADPFVTAGNRVDGYQIVSLPLFPAKPETPKVHEPAPAEGTTPEGRAP